MCKSMRSNCKVIILIIASLMIASLLKSPIRGIAESGLQLDHSPTVNPTEMVQKALKQAQEAGFYRISTDVQQTVRAADALSDTSLSVHVDGEIAGPHQSRFVMGDGRVRVTHHLDKRDGVTEKQSIRDRLRAGKADTDERLESRANLKEVEIS